MTARLPPGFVTIFAKGRSERSSRFSASRLNDRGSTLVIGLLESNVLSNINRQVYIACAILSLVTIIVLLAAWIGGSHFIVRPIRALVHAASAVGRGDDDLPARLVEEADAALYAAKRQGRNRIVTVEDVFALAS